MKRNDRDAYLRQGVVLPETPRQRREREALDEDLRSIELRGRPLPLRLRNFRPTSDSYLRSAGGPLAYMVRLRSIEDQIERHVARLEESWWALADECGEDVAAFTTRWQAVVRTWSFDEVNDLIDRHNRWYPIESRLPMDPRTGTYALVDGRDYHLDPLGAQWILRRFPDRPQSVAAG